jgi:hypothetical protein
MEKDQEEPRDGKLEESGHATATTQHSGTGSVHPLIIRLFQLSFLVRTVFFSHNKSVNRAFQPSRRSSFARYCSSGPDFKNF